MAPFQNSAPNKYIKRQVQETIEKVGGEKLTKTDEMDWMDIFETKKSAAKTLKTKIDKIDTEIGQMVYAFYGLIEEEIKIVGELKEVIL